MTDRQMDGRTDVAYDNNKFLFFLKKNTKNSSKLKASTNVTHQTQVSQRDLSFLENI